MTQIILKQPTIQEIRECELKKSCLIPLNRGSFFRACEVEQRIKSFVLTEKEIEREKEIESILDFGFPPKQIEIEPIPSDVLAECYSIIVTGYAIVDVFNQFICPISDVVYRNDEELSIYQELNTISTKKKYLSEIAIDSILGRYNSYLVLQKCLFKTDFTPVFSTVEDIFNSDPNIIATLASRFIEFKNYIPERVFRAIARGEGSAGREWLSYWYGTKANNNRPFDILDNNKLSLCRWTDRYDNIRGGYEPPPDDIINNDSKLDSWLFQKRIDAATKGKNQGNVNGMNFNNHTEEVSVVAPDAMTFIGD